MRALAAAGPIVVVLVLMVVLRWPAAKAGTVGALVAASVAVLLFGPGTGGQTELGLGTAAAGTLAEALFTSATILWIIVPALAIHHLQVVNGATEVLRLALGSLSDDPRILALLIGWFFALFVEGAAGFGASVALAAPFLVGVGYQPLAAVTIALIGHAVGVSFGAIGTPIVPQVEATGLAAADIAAATAIYHTALGWFPLAVMVVVASRATSQRAVGAIWGWAALAGAAFLLPSWLIARYVGPELPTLGGALAGVTIFVLALRAFGRHPPGTTATASEVGPASATTIVRAGAPYLVLIVLVLLTRTVPAVRDPLGAVELTWELAGGFTGSFRPLTHPGTLLALAFLGGALWQRVSLARVRTAVGVTAGQLGAVAVALVAMLTLARTMVNSGMTEALALAAAGSAGAVWPVISPFVGVLGTFVTGSATASNVLFTDLQEATAVALGLPVLPLIGAQGFGAAVGNIVCPHNIVAAGATVGLTGAEGDVLRRTLGVAVVYALLGGLIALAIV
jgi:lactate permease